MTTTNPRDAAIVAVLDLHYEWGTTCAECSHPGWNVQYPCSTVRAITEHLKDNE